MNMKVIIVEDEPRVRKGLSESVNWELLGLQLVGTASNGLEGLELFKSAEPALVIADIRMPIMDGLAMTEAIMELRPSTKVMIISGHDEFEYAQRCVVLGVDNYLLKPIGKKQFLAELEKLKLQWLKHVEERENKLQFEKKLRSNLPLLRNAFLEEWLAGSALKTQQALIDSCSFLEIPYDARNEAAIAIFELDLNEEDSERFSQSDCRLLQFAMNNIIEELMEGVGTSFQRGNGQSVILFQTLSSDAREDLFVWAEKTKAKISAILHIGVTVGLGGKAVNAHELPKVFQEAQHTLRLKLALGTDIILYEGLIRPDQEEYVILNESDVALLIHGVEMNREEEIEQVIRGLFRNWKSKHWLGYPDEMSYQFAGLFTSLAHRLGRSIRSFLDDKDMQRWKNPERFRSIDDICEWWINQFVQLSKAYAGFRADRKTQLIQGVIAYIDEHIFENITREEAAKHVYIHSSYLSRMFKEVMGESFSEFVLCKKMEKAMHMLQVDRVMVYEVADRLGYKDPSYFARVFKKYTGKSPSEFQ